MAGRVVAITGAFGVLGTAVAQAARTAGMRVALIDYAPTPSGLSGGDDVLALGGVDLADAAAASGAMDAIVSRFGALHALINCAGGFVWSTLADSDAALWERLYRLNVVTTSNACRAATAALAASGSGRIVNVGAGAAEKAAAGMGAYAASKAGVHRLTEALAEELKGKVTVNAVLPSIIDTPMNRSDMPKADFSSWVAPAELAAVMLFLASEAASGVTGALVRVSGRV
jgi:NAD(P)-dependent dehydrogenase (short-subunit alcohol dehydrogenase family)